MASVHLEQVHKHYGDVHIVRALELHVADGELVVLVGPSGCGKSTTLRMVAGLEEITGGTLRIGDKVANDLSPRDRDIAMVFQSYALYPHMTVYENMAFGLRIRKLSDAEIDRRVRDAARFLGLEALLERRPKALSGGQRQRVAMGRAVVREPSVFLFDEPLSNLDAKLRVAMRIEVARLHERLKATILYVTHDQVEAMTLADRIAVMHKGVLQQVATPSEIYTRPANTFVATFIGSPAMNLWPVQVRRDGQGWLLDGGAVRLQLHADRPADAALFAIATAAGEGAGLTLGCRPQEVEPCEASDAELTLQVDVVEPLGAETFVYGSPAGVSADATGRDESTQERLQSPSIVRLEPQHLVRSGEILTLRLRPGAGHLFDADGNRMTAPSAT